MKHQPARQHPVPAPLRSRLSSAVEIAPAGEFRLRGAGSQIAHLFGPELQQRLAARARNKTKGVTACTP